MILKGILNSKKYIIPIVIMGILFLLVSVPIVFSFFSWSGIYDSIDNAYLLLNERAANFFLKIFRTGVVIKNHEIFFGQGNIPGFIPETLYKKWTLVVVIIFWMTRTTVKKKLFFSILVLMLQFILISAHIAVGAWLGFRGYTGTLFPASSLTFGMVCLLILLLFWWRDNKGFIFANIVKIFPSLNFLEKRVSVILGVMFIYVLLSSFFLHVFEFRPWINFLFSSAREILMRLGYHVTVEPHYLVGDNGTIYMSKGCLGFTTMLLFASVVYLTGDDNRKRWIYIFSGLILLNIVNILRFVFLFIHIQKHGGYELAMDLHDMYDYVIYTIVFILWIIWFEKFSDIRKRKEPVRNTG